MGYILPLEIQSLANQAFYVKLTMTSRIAVVSMSAYRPK